MCLCQQVGKKRSDTSWVILDVSETACDQLMSQQFADKKHLQMRFSKLKRQLCLQAPGPITQSVKTVLWPQR